ncbi:XTP/dITP diphosphatase [Candidatus Bathyarchaeota archaeon]|nr:XTP/dITP diphosphatase [Candidatus Bathyarchaeota archaeon]
MPLDENFPYGKLIFFATGNLHKFNEARKILAEYDISVAMLKIKTLEIQSDDIEEIAKASVLNATREVNLPTIVEDAGLFIKALNGFPGPYSSYIYRTIGVRGILKLLEEVENREAQFRSVVAFYDPSNESLKCFQGVVEGVIARKPRGYSGFGFDPIFEPKEYIGKTFGEMSIEEKNRFSHRAKALRKFAEWYKHLRRL